MIPAEARNAWRDIEARLRPYVARRVSSAAEVDDITQEILMKVHKGIDSVRDGERFGGWVYRIAARAIADAARGRARSPIAGGRDLGQERATEVDEAADLQAELGECVALFVARLPTPYREAVTLTDLQGTTQRDAAEMLGLSLSGMKSRVQRGREKIRAMFEECCEIDLDCRGRVVVCDPRAPKQVSPVCGGAKLKP